MEGHWKDGREHTLAFSERVPTTAIANGYDIMGWNGFLSTPTDGDWIDHEYVDRQHRDWTWGPAFVWYQKPVKCSYINGEECLCPQPDYTPCSPLSGTGRYTGPSCTDSCNTTDRPLNARPASEHGGGVNVAFASGRALFLRETIDYRVLRALMTLNDKTANIPLEDKGLIFDDSTIE